MTSIDKATLAEQGNMDWEHNWTLGGLDYYCEIKNDQSGEVWLCQAPISHQEFQTLRLPDGFSRVAIGRAAHDAAYFRCSPEATEDSPIETIKVGERIFSKVAKMGKIEDKYFKEGFRDLLVLAVHKYHKVMIVLPTLSK